MPKDKVKEAPTMTEFPMTKTEKRRILCKNHVSEVVADCFGMSLKLVCKHCGKLLGETDDPVLYDKFLNKRLSDPVVEQKRDKDLL